MLDAATGETINVVPGTEGTEEILWQDGVLLLVARKVTQARAATYTTWEQLTAQTESPLHLRDTRAPVISKFRGADNQAGLRIVALDSASGQVLWEKAGQDSVGLWPLSLRACGERVYYQRRGDVHCLDLRSGETVWVTASSSLRALTEEALVCVSKERVTLRSPSDGKLQWSQPVTLATIRDVFIIGNSIWLGGGKPYDSGHSKYTGPSWGAYFAVEHDLATGNVVKEITAENPNITTAVTTARRQIATSLAAAAGPSFWTWNLATTSGTVGRAARVDTVSCPPMECCMYRLTRADATSPRR